MGTMVRRYTRPVMGTDLRESSSLVKRANSCVMRVAKARCHVVRKMAVNADQHGKGDGERHARTYGSLRAWSVMASERTREAGETHESQPWPRSTC